MIVVHESLVCPQQLKKERATVCGHHLLNYSFLRGCPAVVSLTLLLSLSLAPNQEKLIYTHLCFLTGQIYIPEAHCCPDPGMAGDQPGHNPPSHQEHIYLSVCVCVCVCVCVRTHIYICI